ncbi:BatD family protein [Pseudomonas sp. PDM18]|nr:BatD family protein [Pseudomonas sp. PDM18]
MTRVLAILLLCLPLLGFGAEPEVKVRAQLLPGDSVMVGGTLNLQLDLLVDTWFSQPPQLPPLKLVDAVVSEPASEATHLTEKIGGKTFFGLRFHYQITPQSARAFAIPPLDIQVQPGQGSGPVQVHSQALHFTARQPAGAGSESAQRLVASRVTISQELTKSHEPLRVGDSVTRKVHVRAEGAQAMLIPAPAFTDVDGLRRYLQAPTVQPLSDGRGGVLGGERMDAVTYVVTRAGDFQLPAIELPWWSADSGEEHSASAPALKLSANGSAVYEAPFSISDDLRELGRRAQVRIASHWLALAVALMLLAAFAYVLRTWGGPLRVAVLGAVERRRQAWWESPAYAWRQVRQQLDGDPPQVGALYLWLRRTNGCREMSAAIPERSVKSVNPLLAFLRGRYGRPGAQPGAEPGQLIQALPDIRRELGTSEPTSLPAHALKPLNP